MFQSRSQWQFIWWTHKKAKYSPVTHFWESEAHVSPVSIFTVASLRLRHKLSVSWHQAALCRSRQLSEPGETQSVSARSARCITASHVSRDPSRVTKFWVLTCDCVKCDSNSLKLSSISLSGCDKRNSPIKLFLTSAESQHQTLRSSSNAWVWHWYNKLRERRAGIRSDLYQWRVFMAPL